MVPTPRSFRVFVSSTFDDLVAERDTLQRGAFVRLRALCEARGARFQAVDLRWGVSEEAALDQRTVPLCLAEVERCRRLSPRPSFLAILGDRYGWRPLPFALSADQWERACGAQQGGNLELLRTWYRLDDNAVPPVAVLQPRGEAFREPAAWQEVEDRLRVLLEPVTGTASSATEQEMQAGVLSEQDGGPSGFAFLRTIDGLPEDASAAPYVDVVDGRRDQDATSAVASLRARLRERLGDRVHEYQARWQAGTVSTDHLDRLDEDVYDALAGAIGAELDRLEELDPLDVERDTHARFAADRCTHLVGRAEVLARLARLRQESTYRPVAVWGVAGSGKSAVLAEAARIAAVEQPGALVVCRFVGATPSSSLGPELLRGVWAEVDRAYGVSDAGAPGDENQLLSRFHEQLGRATEEQPLVLLLDGLDQLPAHDPVRRLTWLPDFLPPHVWVAVSTRPGVELDRMRQRFGEDQVVEVPGLSGSDGAGLLAHWLGSAGRTLQPAQERAVLAAFEASGGLPLHLRLASEEARLWPSWEEPAPLPTGVPGLIEALFARLSEVENHGELLMSRALGLLAASRDGLTEDELLDLLSADADVMADFARRSPRSPKVERLPVVVWSRLFADLEPYLTARSADGTVTIGFYHRELADAAARAYLGTARHEQLADHFTRRRVDSTGPVPLRVLAELPFQLARAGRLDEATDLLTDHAFVQAKVAASGVSAVVEDLDEIARQGGDDRAVGIVREALLLSVDALTRDRAQLSGHLVGRLALVAEPRVQRLVAGARDWRGPAWLRPLTASLVPPGEPLVRILRGRFDPASAAALSPDGRFAAGGSYGRDVRVWDLSTGLEVVRFEGERPGGPAEGQGGDRIVDLRFAGDSLVAVSADRCAYVVDLRSGVGRTAIRGETDNLYAMAILDESHALSAPRSIWGFGATTLQVWDLDDGESREVPGLEGTCERLAVSADGRMAISRGDHDLFTRWDLEQGQPAGAWTIPGSSVATALSPDGTVWAAGTAGGDVQIGGEAGPTHTFSGHRGAVAVLLFARSDLLVSAGDDGTVRLWDLGVGRELRCLRGHGSGVLSLAVSPDGRWILSGGADGAIHVWDLAREPIGLSARPPATHAAAVVDAAVGDDGAAAATLAADDSVLRWDLAAGTSSPRPPGATTLDEAAGRTPVPAALRAEAEELDENAPRSASDATHAITAVAVSADGRRALTASTDNVMVFYRLNVTRDEARVRLWDLTTHSRLGVLAFAEESGVSYSRAEAFRCVAVDATGRFGAAGGDDRTLRVWDLDRGEPVATFTADAAVTACAMSPDGRTLVAGESTGRVHLLRLEPAADEAAVGSPTEPLIAEEIRLDPQAGSRWGGSLRIIGGRLETSQGWVESVAVSPDGERALVAGEDGSVVLWNLVDRRTLPMDEVHGDWATTVAYAVDGRLAASGSADGSVRVWEAATGRLVHRYDVPAGSVWSLAAVPDGRRWLVGDGEGGVLVWDPSSSETPDRIEVHDGAVTAVAQLGGRAVASASVDGTVAVCDAGSGAVTWRSAPGLPVWALAVVGGDVCAGRHTALETWDVLTGHQRWSLETGHRSPISALAATPDGERVVTGSVDGEVRVTDAAAGRPLGLVLRTGWPVDTVAVTPDGKNALVGGHGAEVFVVPLEEPLTVLEETIRDRFTDTEWAVVRRLPGIAWGYVASADGMVQQEEVIQMARGSERHLPTGTPAREFAALLVEEADSSWNPEPGTVQAPEVARFDGDLGLARAVLRRRLSDEEHDQVVTVLIAAAREVAAQSGGLLRTKVSKEEEAALRHLEELL
jgi:WD40 repeat protein